MHDNRPLPALLGEQTMHDYRPLPALSGEQTMHDNRHYHPYQVSKQCMITDTTSPIR